MRFSSLSASGCAEAYNLTKVGRVRLEIDAKWLTTLQGCGERARESDRNEGFHGQSCLTDGTFRTMRPRWQIVNGESART